MELLLFYKSLDETLNCLHPAVSALIIDLENEGKGIRQLSYDTQINSHTINDLNSLRNETKLPIIVRINGFPHFRGDELKASIDNGADEILLPMVRNSEQIDVVLNEINCQCKLGILIETNEAVESVEQFEKYNLARIYVGLNDLSIERRINNIFHPMVDGTIDKLRKRISVPFGYGGLTHPKLGHPIDCNLLLYNLIKYKADFTFLRRSFYKALLQYRPDEIFDALLSETDRIRKVDIEESESMNKLLFKQINEIDIELSKKLPLDQLVLSSSSYK